MKILISAAACHPTSGSEAYVGWQAVSQLRRDHDLWVLTSGWCREGIESFLEKNPDWRNVRFVYVDERDGALPYSENRMIARLQSWMRYRKWCRYASVAAKRLNQEIKFDLAHHVTYATWRMGSPLSGIGIPWIWGPIGGGENFPATMLSVLSPVAILFEIVRRLNTMMAKRSLAVRCAAGSAALVLPNNPETESLIISLGVPKERIRRLCQSFLPEERLERLKRTASITPRDCGELRCLAGGNLEGRKGVAIALQSLELLAEEGIPFLYTYLGRGPELEHLKALAVRLGIAERVNFVDSLSGDEYVSALQSSHVYLLPSLREGVPVTQMEAMAAGCVPVVADCGGAGPMAISGGSQPMAVSVPKNITRCIAVELKGLWENPFVWERRSNSARMGIINSYSSENYRVLIKQFYDELVPLLLNS
jgi:glycosyltransferase involved in cell wall biosynthesis